MHVLPLMPYHGNLANYWQVNKFTHLKYNFWSWVKEYHGAQLVLSERPEFWQFDNERDMMMFILRWS